MDLYRYDGSSYQLVEALGVNTELGQNKPSTSWVWRCPFPRAETPYSSTKIGRGEYTLDSSVRDIGTLHLYYAPMLEGTQAPTTAAPTPFSCDVGFSNNYYAASDGQGSLDLQWTGSHTLYKMQDEASYWACDFSGATPIVTTSRRTALACL